MEGTGFLTAACSLLIFYAIIKIFWKIDQAKWRRILGEETKKEKKKKGKLDLFSSPETWDDEDDLYYGMPYIVWWSMQQDAHPKHDKHHH